MTTPSIPDMMRLARDFEKQWDTILRDLAKRLEQLEDDAYSPSSTGEWHLWCVTHDRRLDGCEAEATREGRSCDDCIPGPMLDPGSPVSDPTGGTALQWGNPKRSDLKAVQRDLEALLRIVGHVDLLTKLPERVDGATLAMAGRSVAVENMKDGGCDPCSRLGEYAVTLTDEPTDVAGRLPKKLPLCRGHYDFVVRHGKLPTPAQEEQRQRGRRVTERVDPKAHPKGIGEQTSRLIEGLQTGTLG